MKIAWRVDAVKPAMVMDEKYKKPHRKNVMPAYEKKFNEAKDDQLTYEQNIEQTSTIFELRAQKLSLGQISAQVGLSLSQVSRILSGKSRSQIAQAIHKE